ncbi:MAG: plasmid pRiA4b ORF-3 family protein [Flammeovirgaceae bacterium]|nr:plasmid pRiA4b ORF-3 family protein [Flammeovirgaceae bacterium]
MPESKKPVDTRKQIYQLKIHLLKVSPMIWRRIQVRGDTTIAELHYTPRLPKTHGGYEGDSYKSQVNLLTIQLTASGRTYPGVQIRPITKITIFHHPNNQLSH